MCVFAQTNAQASLSSYLSLVSQALLLTKRLSAQWLVVINFHSQRQVLLIRRWFIPRSADPVKVVLFDSGLDQLRLPILRQISSRAIDPVAGSSTSTSTVNTEIVSSIVEKYFEWVGVTKLGKSNE